MIIKMSLPTTKALALGLLLATSSVLQAASQQYCDLLGTFASNVVGGRESGRSYNTTLRMIENNFSANKQMSASDKRIAKRDMGIAARWVYVESPQLTEEGARKLIRLMCITDDLK